MDVNGKKKKFASSSSLCLICRTFLVSIPIAKPKNLRSMKLMGKKNTNNIPENAVDIISPNLQEYMRNNYQDF